MRISDWSSDLCSSDLHAMKASDLLVQCLENEGVEYIFGVPGEENADFMLSLEKSEKIRFILTRHEQGAAFMAEIYGRLTGNPACCLGTLGRSEEHTSELQSLMRISYAVFCLKK